MLGFLYCLDVRIHLVICRSIEPLGSALSGPLSRLRMHGLDVFQSNVTIKRAIFLLERWMTGNRSESLICPLQEITITKGWHQKSDRPPENPLARVLEPPIGLGPRSRTVARVT